MLKVVALCFVVNLAAALPAQTIEETADENSDVGLNVIELVEKYGYPIEQYRNIETEDGYLLDIHRIPHGKNNAGETNKPVVLLMHGLLCSSVDWINMGPEKSLGYILADLGYDVWMGNARGTTWSRKHILYNPNRDKADFWGFSWHEIGKYDLPIIIDTALKTTGAEKLFYIGHSQGTTSFYVMASERPEYNEKIRLMVSLAPVAYMSHLTSPFVQLVALFDDTLEFLADLIGLYEFLPSTDLLTIIGQVACRDDALFQDLCGGVIFLIAGFDSEQLNKTMIPVITTNTPAGSSTKQLVHYGQELNSAKFRQYDFGLISNLLHYGSLTPPNYNLDNVKAPVSLFYSQNDWLAAIRDVEQLRSELPNVVFSYVVPFSKFNHLDFLWAIDVRSLVYDSVIELMGKY